MLCEWLLHRNGQSDRRRETEFWGQSFVSDFYGQIVARAPTSKEHILIADCDLKALEDMRRMAILPRSSHRYLQWRDESHD